MNRFPFIFPYYSASLWLLSACSSFRTEMGRPLPASASGFVEAQTGVEAVVRKMGPPHSATRLPQGFAFLYEHSRISEFQLGVTVPFAFLRYFKFIHAWNRLDQEALLLTFDDRGVLQSAGGGRWREKLGGGSSVQILVKVMSLSDVSKFLYPADAHSWGERLLQPLPIGLNSAQSLRTGQSGLQQRVAPSYSGQHTLEMAKPKTENEKRRIKRDYQNPP